jgi:short-subunit dehydrogenase
MIRSGGGAIVKMSSAAGIMGFPQKPIYVASKHAVLGLTKSAD